MKTNGTATKETRQPVFTALNRLLSDEYVLYTKTRNYHWNVVGPQFAEMHKLFEAQYEELNIIIDEVAERIRALGGRPHGSLKEFLEDSKIKDDMEEHLKAEDMLVRLRDDHEAIMRRLKDDIALCEEMGEVSTENFLTDLLEKHEKTAWMLRSFLVVR